MDESSAVRFARLEDLLTALSEDVQDARKAATELTEALSRRVALLEVGVRALEDRALAEKIIATERDRTAVQRAEGQASTRTIWLGVAVIVSDNLFTVIGALIAGHVI